MSDWTRSILIFGVLCGMTGAGLALIVSGVIRMMFGV